MKNVSAVFFGLFFSLPLAAANANDAVLSASISRDGVVESQKGNWIESVEFHNQINYSGNYTVKFVSGAFNGEPDYCLASTYDQSSYNSTLYGIAKLSGKATKEGVGVITLFLGLSEPSGDSSQGFYLVCGR